MAELLAVDLGLRTGLAKYGQTGHLLWYRSQHYANRQTLRRAIRGVLDAERDLTDLVIEGGGPLALAWQREAHRRAIRVELISAETWRREILRGDGLERRVQAKNLADLMARRVIEWSGARRPSSLRHDAAEAILIGFWKIRHLGWTSDLPRELEGAKAPGPMPPR